MASKKKASAKVGKVMHEWKTGTLHSGGPKGPIVKSKKQAVAIAMSEAGMSKKVPKGYHRMPDGKLMKGTKHKGK